MAQRTTYLCLLLPCVFLLSSCALDLNEPATTDPDIAANVKREVLKTHGRSIFPVNTLFEISENDLHAGDLLFSSTIGMTSLGIRAFSTSSVSHVAVYLGDGEVAEATGAGVQIVPLRQAIKHSDKLFALRLPDLTTQQAADIKAFAYKIKDSGYNYRGIIEFIPFMMMKKICSLNPFSQDFRQQCVSGLAKAQLSDVPPDDKKTWFCSEFVSDAFSYAGRPLTVAKASWISPADLLHMREGGAAVYKPETELQYVGHIKLGVYNKAQRFIGLYK